MPAIVSAVTSVFASAGVVIGTVGAGVVSVIGGVRLFSLIKVYMMSRIVSGAVRDARRRD